MKCGILLLKNEKLIILLMNAKQILPPEPDER